MQITNFFSYRIPIVAMVLVFGISVGCQDFDVDCSKLTNNFQVDGYFGLLAKGSDQLILDNSAKNGYVLGDSLVINTTFDSLMVIFQSVTSPSMAWQDERPGTFWESAFAACETPPLNFTTNISNISIKSNNSFETGFEAGKNLNSFFDIRQANEDAGFLGEKIPVTEFVSKVNKAASLMVIRPNKAPSISKGHIFTITILHADGASFEYKSPLIRFE